MGRKVRSEFTEAASLLIGAYIIYVCTFC